MQDFYEAARQHPNWHWYAIADAAQHKALPKALGQSGTLQRCLLDAPPGSPLAAVSPHLVQLPSPEPDPESAPWMWLRRNAPGLPCATVVASTLPFEQVFAHFKPLMEVLLPDGQDMVFAFWDPAILGTLVGQADDATLHVPGPVLSAAQRATFLQALTSWWYWDRLGALHCIDLTDAASAILELDALPLQLTQPQVDDLVEASVPDHVLHYVDLNQGHLLSDIPPKERYPTVRNLLVAARDIKLDVMSDLVNYVCAALIYKDRFASDKTILDLL